MAKRKNRTGAVQQYSPTREKVKMLVGRGLNYAQTAKVLGVTRQRVTVISKEEGLSKVSRFPRYRACTSTAGDGPHEFLAQSSRETRCGQHRYRRQVCVSCGSSYPTFGQSVDCLACRNKKRATQNRSKNHDD